MSNVTQNQATIMAYRPKCEESDMSPRAETIADGQSSLTV